MAKVLTLKQQILSKQEKILQLHKELQILKAQCQHTELKEGSSYFSGSYYDRATTEYYKECLTCGKIFHTNTQTHNYYG